MNSRTRTALIATAAILGWAALIANLHPGFELDDAERVLAVALAIAGTLILAVQWLGRPAAEVYHMGFEEGRRQGKIEEATKRVTRGDVVVQFRQHRSG